ncbi:DNA repair protein RadA [Seminavis robusta]|uniref:DNA repair protein RadA n=1 Tax=Seminavis robusta TaxID=568900 RepID=A0A9N8EIL7_9STRA|nr:DNA repair protein RadA [Seminavis robusta]|eukprot:Sro1014_g231440.1 DNA repair protein RadA (615) ;mRNA; r:20539-22383
MGTSGSSKATVHVCTNCGCETVKWHGRCPTCKEWNTLQEFAVQRERKTNAASNSRALFERPIFSSSSNFANNNNNGEDFTTTNKRPSSSWIGGTNNNRGFPNDPTGLFVNPPVRINDVLDNSNDNNKKQNQRIVIPDDEELNTVFGGGIMKGSLCLLGGSPGVGKSTLLLQTAASIASNNLQDGPVWYVSGEETAQQIAERAKRLGCSTASNNLYLLSETHVDTLAEQVVTLMEAAAVNQSLALYKTNPPSMMVIDSIQTMICEAGGASAAGGVTQMRESVALLLRIAKSTNIPIILVGHVTKSGDVAGPRTVEHQVDCVAYLEGLEGGGEMMNLRMLRTSKNRFGAADNVGVYEMTAGRLLPVSDPSSLLLAHRLNTDDQEGCAITVAVEGIRAMTVEIQALVTPSCSGPTGGSKRNVNGIAYSRLALLLRVLQKRCGMFFGRQDVYVNVVGSVRLGGREGGGSSDLTVAVALVSSLASIPVRSDTAFVGEVGLLGELRPVAAMEKRILEAQRMGFLRIITPMTYTRKQQQSGKMRSGKGFITTTEHGIERVQCSTLLAAINAGLVQQLPKRRKRDSTARRKGVSAPGSLGDLNLDPPILDDDDDDDESAYQL